MSDYGFFWNSRDGDRKYNADDFATWLRKFFTSGVFNGELFVSAAGGMTVSVDSGYANVDGKVMFFEDPQTFTLDVAHSTLPRVDTVVVEADYAERVISCKVVKGEPGGQATPPERTTDAYQLVLAQIAVRAGATQITQANITDTRWNESLCGYVAGTVDEMSWDEITAQWQAYLSEFQADQLNAWNTWIADREGEYTTWTAAQQALYTAWIANQQEDFLAWYDRMKDQLDEDAAGHLQMEIDNLDVSITSRINATNGMIADMYDPYAEGYVAGDNTVLNDVLYECTAPTSGEFDPTKWTPVKVEDQIKRRWVETRILAAANWVNGEYDLSGIYPNNKFDIDVAVCNSTTKAQREAWGDAQPIGDASSNVIHALDKTPTIDITVMVTVFEK